MKTTKRKIISFFVLLFLSFTIIIPAYAEWEETWTETENQEEQSVKYISQSDFIKSHQPENKWEVTIRKKKKTIEVINYNLSTNDDQLLINKNKYILPTWMNTISCNTNEVGSVFFWDNNTSCQKFTLEWEWMNEFSKAFFSDIIENKRKSLNDNSNSEEGNAEDSIEWKQSNEESVNEIEKVLSWESVKEVVEDIQSDSNNTKSNEDSSSEWWDNTTQEGILAILGWLDIPLDDINEEIEWTSKELNTDISSFLEWENSWEQLGNIGGEPEIKTSTWIVIWDISSWDKLNTSVDRILEKFLDPDKYVRPVKIEEVLDDEDIEIDDEKSIEEERSEIPLEELFPDIYINSDVNSFTQKLFGPEVKNVMYGANIDSNSLLGVSANYLAISLEKFRAQKEILEVWGNQIFGLKWFAHYNKSVTELYEKFLTRNPSISEQKQLAKNISAISFSFSTYSNSTINYKTKDVFRNKLILDFQKLEKDYKSISKQNIIRNFLLRR